MLPLSRSRTSSAAAPLLTCIVLAGLLVIAPQAAAAQPQTPEKGAVQGLVTEVDGAPLPGTTVRLIGPLPVSTVRVTTADLEGHFEFPAVEPGTYRMEAELPGFELTQIPQIVVRALQASVSAIVMQFRAIKETVQVTAQTETAPELVERESTSGRSVVSNRTLESLPLPSEQVLEALPLLPGVVRGRDGRISIGGTMPSDSILLFNGVDLTDPFTGQYRLRLPLEAVAQMDLHTGVYPSTYGQLIGGLVDITTAPGGEKWKFQFNNFLPRVRFNKSGLGGVEAASPRFRLSGPLIPGRLYLSQAGEYHFDSVDINDVPGPPGGSDNLRTTGWESLTQLDWFVNDRHRFSFTTILFPQDENLAGLNGLTPVSATTNIDRRARTFVGEHQWLIDSTSLLKTSVQLNQASTDVDPLGVEPLEVIPEGVQGNAFHQQGLGTTRWQGKVVYSRALGDSRLSHLLEVGGVVQRLSLSGDYENDTILVEGASRQLLQRIDFAGSGSLSGHKTEWAGFVQDRWKLNDRFALDLGTRVSSDSFTNDLRLEPRIGSSWDLTGNGATFIKAAAGLMHRRVFLGEALWEQLPTRVETTPVQGIEGGGVARALVPRLGKNISAPKSFLVTVEVDQKINPGLIVRAKYAQREGHDLLAVNRLDPQGVLVDADEDAFNAVQEDPAAGLGTLLLDNSGSSTYRELELTVGQRIARDGQVFFSYVRSSSVGDLNDFNNIAGESPAAIVRPNRRARLPFDSPNRFLFWGTINLPNKIRVAPVVEWRSGFPYSLLNEDQSYLGKPNSQRFPSLLTLDTQITKDFKFAKYHVRAGVKLFNIGGKFNPRDVISNVASPFFGDLRNNVGFQLRGKFQLLF
ncbi:MAG: TonB-dependent receptor domain-containing protein [Acidobacteriota bacterium]